MSLPRYNPEGRCPKCQHDDVATHYRPSAESGFDRRNGKREFLGHRPERLERICQRCRYEWDERIAPKPRKTGTSAGPAGGTDTTEPADG